MKKFNIILMLLLMFFLTGCCNKKFDLYQGSQDIKITRKSDSGTARINISDTYKKGGEKYFIFTTDMTGEQEFTLSEKKYDEYIGNDNDAVDYTSYNIQFETSLYKYRKNIFTSIYSNQDNTVEIINSLEKYPDIEVYKENETSVTYSSLYIKKYQDNRFNKTDYTVSSESDSKYFTGRSTERLNVTHYSFMGEHDFTDDEVNHYCKVMDEISNNILSGIYQKN